MKNLEKANQARAEKILSQKINFRGLGILSYRELANSKHITSAEAKEVPSVVYNRTKYNRMNGTQQEEFDKKYNQTKIEYRLFVGGGSFYTVPKTVYDYFNSLK